MLGPFDYSVYVASAVSNVPPRCQDVAVDIADLDLETRLLAGLPIVNVFYDWLGIDRLLETHVPGDPRLRVSPSAALGVVIRQPGGAPCPGVCAGRVGFPLRPEPGRPGS